MCFLPFPNFPKIKPQLLTLVTSVPIHPWLTAFPSLYHFPHPCQCSMQLLKKLFAMESLPQVSFRGNPTYDKVSPPSRFVRKCISEEPHLDKEKKKRKVLVSSMTKLERTRGCAGVTDTAGYILLSNYSSLHSQYKSIWFGHNKLRVAKPLPQPLRMSQAPCKSMGLFY